MGRCANSAQIAYGLRGKIGKNRWERVPVLTKQALLNPVNQRT